ncbi:4'-phosphopantetheinyl transferase [Calocera cornea HHB12733]|uniref:holo-[acyl-carrier-protein] synthase n=1 Tax=Calocera cornea HHB12733 TaxID=1353952 RepID=A0A165H189_9BASI|nr:4'-phosphopantetheinyl transferase [Calocera cornea HHB12733]
MAAPNSHIRMIVLPWFPQDSLFDPALRLLDSKSQAAVTRFYRKEDQWRTLLGRHLTIHVLHEQGAQGELRFEKAARGKPYLAHPPMNPPILFNVSHDNNLITLGYSRPPLDGQYRIGVDCMKLAIRTDETPRMFVEVISDQLTPGERDSLLGPMSDAQRIERAFIIWTIKEAFIKAIGEGMAFDLQQIDCRLDQGEVWMHGAPSPEWEFRLRAVEISGSGEKERYAVASCEWVGQGGRVIFEDAASESLEVMTGDDLLRRIGLEAPAHGPGLEVTLGRLKWLV